MESGNLTLFLHRVIYVYAWMTYSLYMDMGPFYSFDSFLLEPDDEKLSCPVPSGDGSTKIHLSQ